METDCDNPRKHLAPVFGVQAFSTKARLERDAFDFLRRSAGRVSQ
jgi:hypothetical protein